MFFVFCVRLCFGYSFCCVLSRQMHCMGIVFVVVFVVVLVVVFVVFLVVVCVLVISLCCVVC